MRNYSGFSYFYRFLRKFLNKHELFVISGSYMSIFVDKSAR